MLRTWCLIGVSAIRNLLVWKHGQVIAAVLSRVCSSVLLHAQCMSGRTDIYIYDICTLYMDAILYTVLCTCVVCIASEAKNISKGRLDFCCFTVTRYWVCKHSSLCWLKYIYFLNDTNAPAMLMPEKWKKCIFVIRSCILNKILLAHYIVHIVLVFLSTGFHLT